VPVPKVGSGNPVPPLEVALNMKWPNNRFLLLSYFVLLTVLVTVGCTSKEDPSEVLPLCGNHTCGDLKMVTTDTSSDGFHYLNPTLSPDGSRILFSADWKAIPSIERYDEDAFYTQHRQMIVIPVPDPYLEDPSSSLRSQDAMLIRISGFLTSVYISGSSVNLDQALNDRKGGPIWMDDENVIFWMNTPRGNRLFTSDISGICPDPACNAAALPMFMEPDDATPNGGPFHHMEPALSPDGNWLLFTRSGCAIPDSFETCTNVDLRVLRMDTWGLDNGYDADVLPLTTAISRLEKPRWSPDGSKIIFSAGLDLDGESTLGTEIFTIDFDTTGWDTGALTLNNNLDRLTYTKYSSGDPIVGVFNTSPAFTPDMSEVYFVSSRRAPSITLHDRNLWRIPADGSLDPEILFFTRADDMDLEVQADGSILFSSLLGFPTEMLDRLEDAAYQDIVDDNNENNTGLTEVEMRALASDQRRLLEFFEGVMAQLYFFTP
jgi:Tol biopolymer transport system component